MSFRFITKQVTLNDRERRNSRYYGRPVYSRCEHYIFILFVSSFFFSSPNLSGRRLDVYHTYTHGVVLVRIYNAGLKCTARASLKIQDAKNRHLRTIAQLCRAIFSQLRYVSTIGKKLLNSNIFHMSLQYGELQPTSG